MSLFGAMCCFFAFENKILLTFIYQNIILYYINNLVCESEVCL